MTSPAAPATGAAPEPDPRYINEQARRIAPRGEHLQYGSLRGAGAREPRARHSRTWPRRSSRRSRRHGATGHAVKPAAAGPPPGGSKQQAVPPPYTVSPRRPEPCRQRHAGARRACAAPPEAAGGPVDVRRLEATGWSGHRQNYACGYVFDRREVPGRGRRVRPHMYKAAVILVSPRLYMYTYPVGTGVPGGLAGAGAGCR